MKVLLILTLLVVESMEELNVRGIQCESKNNVTKWTFFDRFDTYGWTVDFKLNRTARTIQPVAFKKDTQYIPKEFIEQANDTGPIVTWVYLKQPNRDLCMHYFSIENGTWDDWGYLNWYYSYPEDNLPKLPEMSDKTKYERNIYFATHVIDSVCQYMAIYYGTSYSYSWAKMRGFVYGFNWDLDRWEGLDSLDGLNKRNYLYPRFVLVPGVMPNKTGDLSESIIFYNDHKVSFGSIEYAIMMKWPDEESRKDIKLQKPTEPRKHVSEFVYQKSMNIHVDKE